ncbi:MAG: glycosyl transferase group 1 [Firmicutes bacterium]|nr:glycosyl transferase group 1 [Bacillota bacterium]
MKRVTILSSADPRQKRGLQVVALTHAKSLRKYGYETVLYCPSLKYESYELEGVPVYTFAFQRRSSSVLNFVTMMDNCWRGWKRHFGKQEPDILHGHDYMTYYFLSKYLSKKVNKIFTVHDPMIYHHKMLGRLPQEPSLKEKMMTHIENSVYARSSKIHCISEYTLVRIADKEALASKLRIVPDWIDMDKFILPVDKGKERLKLGFGSNNFVIYTLRGLQARMGIGNLIQAFKLFKDSIPGAKLIIGGDGPLRNELEELARSLNISDSVTFLGYVPEDEVIKRYQAADIFIMPSIDGEGFGLPVLESMACGTPVLASPSCALPEVLSGKRARLFAGILPEDIAAGIMAFHRLWQVNGIDANAERQYVLDHFAEDNIIKLILDDYEP